MVPPYFGFWLLMGAFVADKLGPMWWRLYWVAVAVLLIRVAAILWKRLQLFRMATGFVVCAGVFAAFGLLGGGQREVSAVIGGHWLWFLTPLAAMFAFFLWEIRHSPETVRLIGTYSRTASVSDRFTLRHIPDLSARGDG